MKAPRPSVLLFCSLLFMGIGRAPGATAYTVAINTTAWSGLTGTLAFDLVGGDALVANNHASFSAFSTNGVLSDASNFVLTDAGFFNETLRPVTFGSQLAFTLQLTENRAGPGLDQFSFFLLDPSSLLPLGATSDPTGADALFAIDVTGASGGAVSVFVSTMPGVSWSVTPVQPPAGVPDDTHVLALSMLAACALIVIRSVPAPGTRANRH